MYNPFIRKNNNVLLTAGIAVGALAAGSLAWFYFKSKGSEEDPEQLDAPYHKQKDDKKRPKTDINELHTIPPVPPTE